jgi:colanic acid biosynthesis glycosyl transferase WcaI
MNTWLVKIPFIGTGKGEIEKIAEDSKAGLIAENTIESIYEQINFLLKNPELRSEMVEKGRKFVVKYCDRGNIAKMILI